jgi:hypothetical protein
MSVKKVKIRSECLVLNEMQKELYVIWQLRDEALYKITGILYI